MWYCLQIAYSVWSENPDSSPEQKMKEKQRIQNFSKINFFLSDALHFYIKKLESVLGLFSEKYLKCLLQVYYQIKQMF